MRPNYLLASTGLLAVLVLSACRGEPPAPAAEPPAATAPDEPTPAEPAPTEPAPTDSAPPPAAPAAPPTAARNDPAVINFEGFGPAKFGASEEQVRMASGRPLYADVPADGASCYLLYLDPRPEQGLGIRFMMEDDAFVRYDVDQPRLVAPGNLVAGMDAAAVMAAFPGRVEEQPHKYVEGARNLVVAPADGGEARLVFEVDATGTITSWRIGVPPQVFYVEGCG